MFKLIAVVLIQAFLAMDFLPCRQAGAWCGADKLFIEEQNNHSSTLAPEIRFDKSSMQDIFLKVSESIKTAGKKGIPRREIFEGLLNWIRPKKDSGISNSLTKFDDSQKGITRRKFLVGIAAVAAILVVGGYGVFRKFSKIGGEVEFPDEDSMNRFLSELVKKEDWEFGGYYYPENGKWVLVITDSGEKSVLVRDNPEALGIFHTHGVRSNLREEAGRIKFPNLTDLAAVLDTKKEDRIGLDIGKVVKLTYSAKKENNPYIQLFLDIRDKAEKLSANKEDLLENFERLFQEEFLRPLYYGTIIKEHFEYKKLNYEEIVSILFEKGYLNESFAVIFPVKPLNKDWFPNYTSAQVQQIEDILKLSQYKKKIFTEGIEPSYNEKTWIKIANILGLDVKFLLGEENSSLPFMDGSIKSSYQADWSLLARHLRSGGIFNIVPAIIGFASLMVWQKRKQSKREDKSKENSVVLAEHIIKSVQILKKRGLLAEDNISVFVDKIAKELGVSGYAKELLGKLIWETASDNIKMESIVSYIEEYQLFNLDKLLELLLSDDRRIEEILTQKSSSLESAIFLPINDALEQIKKHVEEWRKKETGNPILILLDGHSESNKEKVGKTTLAKAIDMEEATRREYGDKLKDLGFTLKQNIVTIEGDRLQKFFDKIKVAIEKGEVDTYDRQRLRMPFQILIDVKEQVKLSELYDDCLRDYIATLFSRMKQEGRGEDRIVVFDEAASHYYFKKALQSSAPERTLVIKAYLLVSSEGIRKMSVQPYIWDTQRGPRFRNKNDTFEPEVILPERMNNTLTYFGAEKNLIEQAI